MAPLSVSSGLPETLSSLYPLVLVTSFIFTLVLLSLFFWVRRIFQKISRSHDQGTVSGSSANFPVNSGNLPRGFWAHAFLICSPSRAVRKDNELERLRAECDRFMKENAELRRLQAKTVARSEFGTGELEVVTAHLRVAEADLLKERAIRQRLEERCSKLEAELKGVLEQVAQTYKRVSLPTRLSSSASDELTMLKGALTARDLEIERLNGLLAKADQLLRQHRAA